MELGFQTIGIVGMGLIGGSIAKSIKKVSNNNVYCYDKQNVVVEDATELGVADGILNDDKLKECDLLIVALYPRDIPVYISSVIDKLKQGCVVIDICGVKQMIANSVKQVCNQSGIQFVGCHPMAGKEVGGFQNSSSDLFANASMIITGKESEHTAAKLKEFFLNIGFKTVIFTTAQDHDRIMAYTSQLAHVVSSSYVKSATAKEHKGFSAGSFKDLTRVAKLNPSMWSHLFLANKENLVNEIDTIVKNLIDYRDALASEDEEKLFTLLKEGTDLKEALEREEAFN